MFTVFIITWRSHCNLSNVSHWTLAIQFVSKQVRNNHRILILIKLWRKTKQWYKKYEKSQFCTKDVERILSSHKFSEKYNELEAFYQKTVLKNFAIFTGKNLRWNLYLNKKTSRAFRSATLFKKYSNASVFLTVLGNF